MGVAGWPWAAATSQLRKRISKPKTGQVAALAARPERQQRGRRTPEPAPIAAGFATRFLRVWRWLPYQSTEAGLPKVAEPSAAEPALRGYPDRSRNLRDVPRDVPFLSALDVVLNRRLPPCRMGSSIFAAQFFVVLTRWSELVRIHP